MATDMFGDFKGRAKRIDDIDLPRLGYMIGVGEDELHAIIDTESRGAGFDSQGRPKILFEPHVFYRNLSGAKRDRAVKEGLAYAKWGTKPYGKESEQYGKLIRAMAIDETAALKACSWGLMQVLGENHKQAGYRTPQAMVMAFLDDEEKHLEAAVRFMEQTGIGVELRKLAKLNRPITAEEAVPVVEKYNGAGFRKNKYHTKFATRRNYWWKIKDTPFTPSADDEVIWKAPKASKVISKDVIESVQTLLRDKGFPEVGDVDGKFGDRTKTTIESFQSYIGVPKTGVITDELLAQLVRYPGRPQAPSRANATVKDISDKPTVQAADKLQKGGGAIIGVGTVGGLGSLVNSFDLDDWTNGAEKLRALSDTLIVVSPWILGIATGGLVIWFGSKIIRDQVQAYREGRSV